MNTDKKFMKKIAKLGAEASARAQRERAIDRYNQADPHCRWCNKFIPPPAEKQGENSWAKMSRRKFCGPSCVQKYSWTVGRHNRMEAIKKRLANRGDLQKLRTRSPRYYANVIREDARQTYFLSTTNRVCEKCGYTKHIDVCHIKAIKNFSSTALFNEINARENLIGLCRNCHWELDNPNSTTAVSIASQSR